MAYVSTCIFQCSRLSRSFLISTAVVKGLTHQVRRFILRLNTAKRTDCIKNYFKGKLYNIKFPTTDSVGACLYHLQEWS